MNISQTLLTILGMAGAMLFCRMLPLFLPQKWLQREWLQYLNRVLPLSIMLILLFTSLSFPRLSFSFFNSEIVQLVWEVFALFIVLLSYLWLRNMLLSIVIGIISINLFYLVI